MKIRGVMNLTPPILKGLIITGTDFLDSPGHPLRVGNHTTVILETNTCEQADRFYNARSLGASEKQSVAAVVWSSYWGSASTASTSAGWSRTPQTPPGRDEVAPTMSRAVSNIQLARVCPCGDGAQ